MPEVNVEGFLHKLKADKPPAVVLLDGLDSYMRSVCIDPLMEKYVPEASRAWAVARFSPRDWAEAFERAQTFPMLSPHQILIVDDVEEIESLGEEKREAAVELLERYLKSPAPFTILILQAAKLDKRQRLCKILRDHALYVILEVDERGAMMVANAQAQSRGFTLDQDAASALVTAVNSRPDAIRTEIEKLSLYKQGQKRISKQDVNDLVVSARTSTVWQLIDMLITGNRREALALLDNLIRDGEQLPMMVGALAFRLRKMIESIGPGARSSTSQAMRLQQIKQGLVALYEADTRFKSGVANPRAVMEVALARLFDHPDWLFEELRSKDMGAVSVGGQR